MAELDVTIESFIETIEKTYPNELKFIQENDWSNIDSVNKRIKLHNLQLILTERSVKNADNLYSLALKKDSTENKKVKQVLKDLISFFDFYEARYDYYVSKQDWSSFIDDSDEEDEGKSKRMEAEIKFQSDLSKSVTEFKSIIRKIQMANDKSIINIPVFNDIPIPLAMRGLVESRYPETKELYEEKLKGDV